MHAAQCRRPTMGPTSQAVPQSGRQVRPLRHLVLVYGWRRSGNSSASAQLWTTSNIAQAVLLFSSHRKGECDRAAWWLSRTLSPYAVSACCLVLEATTRPGPTSQARLSACGQGQEQAHVLSFESWRSNLRLRLHRGIYGMQTCAQVALCSTSGHRDVYDNGTMRHVACGRTAATCKCQPDELAVARGAVVARPSSTTASACQTD